MALWLFDRLVDSGKSVIVIEHHQAVVAHTDWIIGLGPDGDRIVFEGTPADLVATRSTLTAQHLAAYVGTRPRSSRRPRSKCWKNYRNLFDARVFVDRVSN